MNPVLKKATNYNSCPFESTFEASDCGCCRFQELCRKLNKRKSARTGDNIFDVSHFLALELMSRKPIGRNKLAEKLGVGDGAIRTIISRLKSSDLIVITKEGCSLTEKGLRLWRTFESLFPQRADVEQTELTHSPCNYAFLVKNSGHKIHSGIEQRDAAIMGGARRAIAIVCRNGHLVIDSVSDNMEKEFPDATKKILRNLNAEENDVIIVAGADTQLKARRGAFAAAWVLIGEDERIS